jgi:putative addiction module component (TIGR02574 family)
MSMALEAVAREAARLTRHEQLALARLLMTDLDESSREPGSEGIWEAEIAARVAAVRENAVQGIPYAEVLARVDRRLKNP